MSGIEISFSSRRSPVLSINGVASCSQPLATAAGLRVMQKGGNAADAAVTIASCLAVLEPGSTGLGGDCFALFFDGNKVHGLNGSGRSGSAASLETAQKIAASMPLADFQAHAVNITVPGAAAGWFDCYEKWGSKILSFEELLQPAIDLAEGGFPVGPITSHLW
jgi:gamma-glutamyltranspeptidase/glutathione hydrolase